MAVVLSGDATAGAPIHCRRTTSLKTYEARATIVVGVAFDENYGKCGIKQNENKTNIYKSADGEEDSSCTKYHRFLSRTHQSPWHA